MEKAEKEPFTRKEVEKIAAAAEYDETAMIIMIFFYTGFRINELFQLTKENVHLENDIPYFIGGMKTEAGKDRIIPIHSRILPYVKHFAQKESKYLIPNTKGGMTHYRRFKDDRYFPLLEKLGIKRRTPHCTRHTFATGLQAKDTKPEDIIRLMGHTDYKTTTENYIHQQLEQLKKSIENLEL
jgi:integrase